MRGAARPRASRNCRTSSAIAGGVDTKSRWLLLALQSAASCAEVNALQGAPWAAGKAEGVDALRKLLGKRFDGNGRSKGRRWCGRWSSRRNRGSASQKESPAVAGLFCWRLVRVFSVERSWTCHLPRLIQEVDPSHGTDLVSWHRARGLAPHHQGNSLEPSFIAGRAVGAVPVLDA